MKSLVITSLPFPVNKFHQKLLIFRVRTCPCFKICNVSSGSLNEYQISLWITSLLKAVNIVTINDQLNPQNKSPRLDITHHPRILASPAVMNIRRHLPSLITAVIETVRVAALSLIKVKTPLTPCFPRGGEDDADASATFFSGFHGNSVINIDVCPESKCLFGATQHGTALSVRCLGLLLSRALEVWKKVTIVFMGCFLEGGAIRINWEVYFMRVTTSARAAGWWTIKSYLCPGIQRRNTCPLFFVYGDGGIKFNVWNVRFLPSASSLERAHATKPFAHEYVRSCLDNYRRCSCPPDVIAETEVRSSLHEPGGETGIYTRAPIDGYRAREESGNKALIAGNKGLIVVRVYVRVRGRTCESWHVYQIGFSLTKFRYNCGWWKSKQYRL